MTIFWHQKHLIWYVCSWTLLDNVLPKYDQISIAIYFVIKLVLFHEFSEKIQLVALTKTEQHCLEITSIVHRKVIVDDHHIHYLRCFCFLLLLSSSKIVCYSIIWYYFQIEKKNIFFIFLLLHHGKSFMKCTHE